VPIFDDPRGDAGDFVSERGEGALLYESGRTRVIRRRVIRPRAARAWSESDSAAGAPMIAVIWKEPLGPGAADRVRHEIGILGGLASVPGVAHLVVTDEPAEHDHHGRTERADRRLIRSGGDPLISPGQRLLFY
jgi:hypothetical protein